MPTVTEDMARSPRLEEELGSFTVTRVFRVSGLVMAREFQLMEAMNEAEIPVYLDEYPFDVTPEFPQYTAIRVRSRMAEPDGPNAARVTVSYTNDFGDAPSPPPVGNDGADVKQIRSSSAPFKTTVDRDDVDMVLDPPTAFIGKWKPYRSEAEVLRPVGSVVFERIELSPPTARMRDHISTLNSSTIGPYAAETLFFADYDAVTEDAGGTWRVTYEFQYSPDGWQHKDRFHAADGKVPEGATEEGWDTIPTSNFSLLGLDFSD